MGDWHAESDARKKAAADAIAALGLTVESKFVPFSQSRNKAEKHKSLNWLVTVKRNGRDVLTTEYGAGIVHCPGYAAKVVPSTFQAPDYRSYNGKPYAGTSSAYRRPTLSEALNFYREAICAAECESGFPMELDPWRGISGKSDSDNVFKCKAKGTAIVPDAVDVLCSLHMDSGVLNSGGFEEWASECGYETDSRKAESIYRACLEIALKFRAAIGEAGLETLATAFQDY